MNEIDSFSDAFLTSSQALTGWQTATKNANFMDKYKNSMEKEKCKQVNISLNIFA